MRNRIKIAMGLTFLSLWIASCMSSQPLRVVAEDVSMQQSFLSWKDVLRLESKIDDFKILNTGSVKVPLKGVLNEDKLPTSHGMEGFIWVDVFAFLFHHTEKGWYMIDAGLDSSFQKEGNIKGLLAGNFIKATRQNKGQNIGAQLKKEDKKINGLFFTHLHGDHSAGLPEIESTIPKYVSKDEKYYHLPLLYHSNHLSTSDTLIELSLDNSYRIAPFENVIDIFGDGSFFGISTKGHSNSHISYLLQVNNEFILLTGDASHTKYGFENAIEPGWINDREEALKSLEQLIAFSQLFPKTKVVYGHEQ